MDLVFEMLKGKQGKPSVLSSKTFKHTGGVIGRNEDCDWVIADKDRHVSNHHATVSYRYGSFFLTDISRNGTLSGENGARLCKGEPQRIEHGSVFVLGDFEIRARLVRDPATFAVDIGRPQAAGRSIPDDEFLDPLNALDHQERAYAQIDDLQALDIPIQTPPQRADSALIEMENLQIPQLIAQPEVPATVELIPLERPRECFWGHLGTALGVDLEGLDDDSREALAINAAHLLKQSIGGLQQSLRTRSELKNELRLALTTAQGSSTNPLKSAADSGEVLGILLMGNNPGQLSGEQAIFQAHRELQAHQVALLTASRAALLGSLEHFSPLQLKLRFERGNKPLLVTAGSHWRAYNRYHQDLCQDEDWSERLLARDFAKAYEEQIRLISTLHAGHQG
ncbi:type VI secretion system-associated FHA domain protein TagH [Pseudomonas sp. DG56-2]|uniref:type VI secretion system-associated FHA domain protein TagH n=1 Tax=Pseudomonas sp. DG56-2 TaxID=2320270 RepID=UPI0010A5D535|nr:type VI secretion system-associated FHA domain protein TagH [Pseudomonas sp. DG56-2]